MALLEHCLAMVLEANSLNGILARRILDSSLESSNPNPGSRQLELSLLDLHARWARASMLGASQTEPDINKSVQLNAQHSKTGRSARRFWSLSDRHFGGTRLLYRPTNRSQ